MIERAKKLYTTVSATVKHRTTHHRRVAIYLLNSLMTSGGAHLHIPIASMFAAAKIYLIDNVINALMRCDNAS